MRALCILFLLIGPAWGQAVLTGAVRVVDADTFDLGLPETVRLVSIDAPEADQACRDGSRTLPCGEMATRAARALFEGRQARCLSDGQDRYGRYLANCIVDGADVGETLVAAGWALRYRDDPTYAEAEKAAAATGRGVWAYEMANPAEWRAAERAERALANAPPDGACAIKGNVSANGQLYHLPGSPSYGATRIDEAAGERWFCDEAEAVAAGWHRAGG